MTVATQQRDQCEERVELGALSFEYTYDALKEATDGFSDHNKLGSGSFGAVYRGLLLDGTQVAIKLIDLNKANKLGLQDGGFVDEVKSLSLLRHRNLVTMMGWSMKHHVRLIVYELLTGGDLQDRLTAASTRPFLWQERLSVLIDAASGLNYMHTRTPKHFHRDIKPANILLDKNGSAKLADFGLAMLAQQDEREAQVKVVAGSKGYVDPHHLRSGKITESNEVYSFGMIILVVVTNKTPEAILDARSPADESGSIRCISKMADATAEWPKNACKNLVGLALLCVGHNAKERPTFSQLLYVLKSTAGKKRKKNSTSSTGVSSDAGSRASAAPPPRQSAHSDHSYSIEVQTPASRSSAQTAEQVERLQSMAPRGLVLGTPLTPVSVLSSPGIRANSAFGITPGRLSVPQRPSTRSRASSGSFSSDAEGPISPQVFNAVPSPARSVQSSGFAMPRTSLPGQAQAHAHGRRSLDETLYAAPPHSLPPRHKSVTCNGYGSSQLDDTILPQLDDTILPRLDDTILPQLDDTILPQLDDTILPAMDDFRHSRVPTCLPAVPPAGRHVGSAQTRKEIVTKAKSSCSGDDTNCSGAQTHSGYRFDADCGDKSSCSGDDTSCSGAQAHSGYRFDADCGDKSSCSGNTSEKAAHSGYRFDADYGDMSDSGNLGVSRNPFDADISSENPGSKRGTVTSEKNRISYAPSDRISYAPSEDWTRVPTSDRNNSFSASEERHDDIDDFRRTDSFRLTPAEVSSLTACEVCFTVFSSVLPATACETCRL